MMEISEWL
uniref:Uncharacterized protein n=1 Tax=Arundo donax TaxID=35708 RepID=A0A0A9DCL5_ARUDO